ncbi:MAG: hypothetical protein KBT31_02830, partial [Firmicutes bacterium]|nr:hypothetical protein [Candidatus Colimorpha enterica]
SYYGDIINCTVKNATVAAAVKNNDDGDKVGGVVGRLSVEEGIGSVKNCTAENVTVKGYRQVGGVLGGAYKTSGSYDVSGNTAKNCTIINDRSNNYNNLTEFDAREVIGTPAALNDASTKENVTIELIKAPIVVEAGATPAATQTNVTNAIAAATAGDTIILPNVEGGVKLINAAPGVTIKGDGNTVINATDGGQIARIDGVTLDGLVINCGQSNYHGFQHSNVTLRNCTINGLLFSYGTMVFEGCTFNQTAVEYNMWAYTSVTYKDCTFNTCGKAVNVYSEGATVQYKVVFDGCTFNNMNNPAKKPAVLIKSNGSNPEFYRYDVEIKNCTVNGNWPTNYIVDEGEAQIGNNPLYDIEKNGTDIKLTVDGVQIYPAA